MDGNLKEAALMLLAKLLTQQDVMEDGTIRDESIIVLLQTIEEALHIVHAAGVVVGREGG